MDEFRRRPVFAALVGVTVFGLLIRLAMLATLALVVTPDGSWFPDGRGYLVWAHQLLTSGDFAGPPLRTPGYPALVAAAYAIGGVRDASVLWLQHGLGLATVGLITCMAARLAGPRVAVATGLLAALDPWHLVFAHYALTEASMVFFVVATAAAVLLPRTRTPVQGVAVGLLAGATCLIRPTAQLLVPVFGAAYLLTGPPASRRIARAYALPLLAVGLGLALSVGPWLAFNAARGVPGLAVINDHLLFVSSVYHRLLTAEQMPADIPEDVRRAFDDMLDAPPGEVPADRFLFVCRESRLDWAQRDVWTRRSIAERPSRYLVAGWHSLRWLLGVGSPGQPPVRDELLWFSLELASEPPGAAVASLHLPVVEGERARPPPARLRALLVSGLEMLGPAHSLPTLPLALLAVVAVGVSLRRGRYPEATLLVGSLAFVAAHALILYPWQRYSLPSEQLWFLSVPILAARFRR